MQTKNVDSVQNRSTEMHQGSTFLVFTLCVAGPWLYLYVDSNWSIDQYCIATVANTVPTRGTLWQKGKRLVAGVRSEGYLSR